jgi:hypothetical protein
MLVFGLPYFATERGRPRYDKYRHDFAKLIGTITPPNGVVEGDANGAPRWQFLAKKFAGKYSHRIIKGGVGHNLPQEARRPLPKPSSALIAFHVQDALHNSVGSA